MKMMDQIIGLENTAPCHFPSIYVIIILYSKNSCQIVFISVKNYVQNHK